MYPYVKYHVFLLFLSMNTGNQFLHDGIISFVRSVRESFPDAVEVYTNGSCYRFYEILKNVYPTAVPYYNIVAGHVISKIGSRYYDITGEVSPEGYFPMKNEPNIFNSARGWMYSK